MVNVKLENGFSSLEILIAFSVIIFCISATTIPILEVQSNLRDLELHATAQQLVSQKIREVQILSNDNFYSIENVEYVKDSFRVEQIVEDVDSWTKLVKVSASWTDLNQNQRELVEETIISNWKLGLGSST